MKINSIQRDIALKQGGSGLRSKHTGYKEKSLVNNSERGYNAEYCGSFTGKSEAATSFLDKILKSKWFSDFTFNTDAHNIATSAFIALILAGIMRPATIMSLPGKKDKEDKIYASGHAIASGILGFAFSTAVTSPFDESIKKVFDETKDLAGPKLKKMTEEIARLKKLGANRTAEQNMEYVSLKAVRGTMQTLIKNIPDWAIAVPRAMLTIALIPPILKYVFGVEKKKKKAVAQQPELNNLNNKPKKDFIEKPIFSSIKGGVK